MAFVIDLDNEQTIEQLEILLNKQSPEYDKFLAIPQACAWANVSAQTLEKIIVVGSYKTKDGVEHPLKVRQKDKNVKAGISARSLVEWANADRRSAGFGAKKARENQMFVIVVPNALVDEVKEIMAARSIKMQTSKERALEVKARKDAKAAAKLAAETTPTA